MFIVDYSSQEREYGNEMKKLEDKKGPPLNLAWGPRGLNPPLHSSFDKARKTDCCSLLHV